MVGLGCGSRRPLQLGEELGEPGERGSRRLDVIGPQLAVVPGDELRRRRERGEIAAEAGELAG
jgi:hypothetical protein